MRPGVGSTQNEFLFSEVGNYGKTGVKKRAWLVFFLAIVGLLAGLAAKAGSFLIVDEPRRSDVISGAGRGNGPASGARPRTSDAGIWAQGGAGCADNREAVRIHADSNCSEVC